MLARQNILLFLLVLVTVVHGGDEDPKGDFYEILDLPDREDTPERDIKQSWKKLSRKYHPDLHGEKTRATYQLIQRAYEVLSDRKMRKVYDMKGEEGLKQYEQSKSNPNQQQNMDPIMRMFGFGGGGGGGAERGANIHMLLLVTLEDMYNGGAHNVKLEKQKLCKACRGTGAEGKDGLTVCSKCKGKGVVLQRIQLAPGFVQEAQQTCPQCGGKGKMIKTKCKVCNGKKIIRTQQVLGVDVEQGTPEGFSLVYDMEADQTPDVIPGDVIFVVSSASHPLFTRKGNDLEMRQRISLKDALLGFTKTFTHLDGHEFEVTVAGPIQYGQTKKIAGEGMPIHHVPSEKGELTVNFEVELPYSLTREQKDEVRRIFAMK